MGVNSAKTMKVKGWIGLREVVVLVDSRASHNFVSKLVVQELGLPCDSSIRCGVQVGNGACIKQQGVCRGVELMIQDYKVVEDFYPFELGSANVALGVTWLRRLGEVRADWS